MFAKNEVSIFDFVFAMSEALDLASPSLNNHHKKVAYIACSIAEEMNLTYDDIKNIALAAILHDVGAFSLEERLMVQDPDIHEKEIHNHTELGYNLFKDFRPLRRVAKLIRYHHADYDTPGVPLGSHVIHLADRVAVLHNDSLEILEQVPGIIEKVMQEKDIYHPDAIDALNRLKRLECFWIEACTLPSNKVLPARVRSVARETVDMKTLREFAKIFAKVIDFRSRFTATHSSGIAAVAMELTKIAGFSDTECKLMEIAGFLHDLGKLAVSNDILEKNGKLDHAEFNVMRKHTYYTYTILHKIEGLNEIAEWAAFHHEKLNGNGYPFHVEGECFYRLSRIMAVADIFTAITEDRPYRAGMSGEETMRILNGMVDSGGIDGGIVELVKENFSHINNARIKAQKAALKEYASFHKVG